MYQNISKLISARDMKKITSVVVASFLSAAMVFGLVYGYQLQTTSALEVNHTNTSTASATGASKIGTTTNTIQLSTKEAKPGDYNWIDSSSGASNPTLKVFTNTANIIKIKNPTDTKHELIIDTGADVLPSSDDINPNGSGQLAFNPTMTGTFTYHCAYHPYTMKGTIEIVNNNP
jgi:hypothetical protein